MGSPKKLNKNPYELTVGAGRLEHSPSPSTRYQSKQGSHSVEATIVKSRKPSKIFALEDFEYLRTLGKLRVLIRRARHVR